MGRIDGMRLVAYDMLLSSLRPVLLCGFWPSWIATFWGGGDVAEHRM